MMKPMERNQAALAFSSAKPSTGGNVPRIVSSELLGKTGQLIIDHGGEDYRLRITSNGKLLLTK